MLVSERQKREVVGNQEFTRIIEDFTILFRLQPAHLWFSSVPIILECAQELLICTIEWVDEFSVLYG